MSMSSAAILTRELKELSKSQPAFNIDLVNDNIYHWNIGLYVANDESLYNGAYLKCQMTFPETYPFKPPTFKFTPSIYHPNVYADGRICISILHEAGNLYTDEPSNENWSPAQCVESVLVSIISFLDDPNINSPANVDASKMFRDDTENYKKLVLRDVERSKKDIPADFKIPELNPPKYDDDFEKEWNYDDDDEEDYDDLEEDDEDASFIEDEEVEMSEDYGENENSK